MVLIAKHIIFKGRVQGVGFRYTASRIASRYNLAGYVKNLPDGSVEMFVQGGTGDVDCCIVDISESFARYVSDKKINDSPHNNRYSDFQITF